MPPQTSSKPLEFTGTAGSYFVLVLVTMLLFYVPIIGFAFAFNYSGDWFAKNVKVNGRTLAYKAGLGETWVMLFVGILLTLVTFGIYIFWFGPKVYRYLCSHLSYADEVPATAASPSPSPTPTTTPTSTPPAGLVQ